MKRFLLIFALVLSVVGLRADSPYSSLSGFGTQYINWTSDELGAVFFNKSTLPVTITELGRLKMGGNTRVHTLKLYSFGGTLLKSVTVNMTGATDNTFVYGAITPEVIPAGGACYILSTESSTGDWVFGPPGWVNFNAQDIGDMYIASKTASGSPSWSTSANGASYGPVTFKFSTPTRTWSKVGTVSTTDGSLFQTKSALYYSSAYDTVRMASGSMNTWGAGATSVTVPDYVTLEGGGASPSDVVVNMATDSPSAYGAGLIVPGNGSVIRNFTINGPAAVDKIPIRTVSGTNDVRISKIYYNQVSGYGSYFVMLNECTRALIDQNVIYGGNGQSEMVYSRGPTNAWNVDDTMGTADNIFIESNIFNGLGYINDANANSRVVVRFNTVNGAFKTDGHGRETNTPQRSFRHMEVYENSFLYASNSNAMEIRGGTGRIFNNTSSAAVGSLANYLTLTAYCVYDPYSSFGSQYQTPFDYPTMDQVGRGKYATTDLASSAASEPLYLWGNRKGGAQWPLQPGQPIPSGGITRYRSQTGNPTATFTLADIIAPDRDYFDENSSFNGSSGVGIGTRAQMDAIATNGVTKKVGAGFWVTDEGDWRTDNGATKDGRLYTWSGSAFVLDYTPYTFPHPLRGEVGEGSPPPDTTAPTLVSFTINAAGTQAALEFSEPVYFGAGGNGGWAVTLSGGAATLTYGSGSGTTTLIYNTSRTVDYNETGTRIYTQPGNGVEDAAGNDLASVSSAAITHNYSTQGQPVGTNYPSGTTRALSSGSFN